MSHQLISSVVKEGDIVVDATAGNGNDTLFMANLVGQNGKVYSFDIQQKAIENTKNKLIQQNLLDRVELIHDSHENIDKYVKVGIKGAMFNLGYLPGGNHNIVTKPYSTLSCLKKIVDLLQVGGIITIVIYIGHDGGEEEKEAVLDFVSKLDNKHFAVQKTEMLNFENYPPIFVCIERVR